MTMKRKRTSMVMSRAVATVDTPDTATHNVVITPNKLEVKYEITASGNRELWDFMQYLLSLYEVHHERVYMEHTYFSQHGIVLNDAPLVAGKTLCINNVPVKAIALDINANIKHIRFMLFMQRDDTSRAGAPDGGYHYELCADYVTVKDICTGALPDLQIGYIDQELTSDGTIVDNYVYNFVYAVYPFRSFGLDV